MKRLCGKLARMGGTMRRGRVDWVDYAKGFCIVMAVTMQATLDVEAAAGHAGWLHGFPGFVQPFLAPAFFILAGLFVSLAIEDGWKNYFDRKLIHFAYFYVLWTSLAFAMKAPAIAAAQGNHAIVSAYLTALSGPPGLLWFIYLLAVFFVAAKVTQRVPVIVVLTIAAALQLSKIDTGWAVVDQFATYFVYFYTGYIFACYIFRLARKLPPYAVLTLAAIILWACVNGALLSNGDARMPAVSLAFGLAGGAAVMAGTVLVAKVGLFPWLRYCGRHSLVIYLACFLPMAGMRHVLLATALITNVGAVCALVAVAGILGSLLLYWAVRGNYARFLFERPAPIRLPEMIHRKRLGADPAH